MKRKIRVNGENHLIDGEDDRRLLDVLRQDMGLMGTKEGCGQGECGACTVLMDGKAVNSCLIYLGSVGAKNIITIEGLAKNGELDVIQQAFVEEGAVQCGFCTPGMIMSAKALLMREKNPDRERIKCSVSGNLCRCTGYSKIITAIEKAAVRMREGDIREL